jgi:hypothetical protein
MTLANLAAARFLEGISPTPYAGSMEIAMEISASARS